MKTRIALLMILALTGAAWAQRDRDEDEPKEPDPQTQEQTLQLANTVIQQIRTQNQLPPVRAMQALNDLKRITVAPEEDLDEAYLPAYWQTLGRAALASGNVDLARFAGEKWRQVEPDNLLALQFSLYAEMAAGSMGNLAEAFHAVQHPQFADYADWAEYMGGLEPLFGEPMTFELPLSDGSTQSVGGRGGDVIVLDFWASDQAPAAPERPSRARRRAPRMPAMPGMGYPGMEGGMPPGMPPMPMPNGRDAGRGRRSSGDSTASEPTGVRTSGLGGDSVRRQMELSREFLGKPVRIIGVNLDPPSSLAAAKDLIQFANSGVPQFYHAENAAQSPVPDPISISDVPTTVVIDSNGQVVFAGDPRTWELRSAIVCALSNTGRSRDPAGAGQEFFSTPPQALPMGGSSLGTPALGPTQALRNLAGGGESPPSPSDQEEKAANQLYEKGRDRMLLGRKAANPQFRAEAIQMWREVIEKYPNTRAADQARLDIDAYKD